MTSEHNEPDNTTAPHRIDVDQQEGTPAAHTDNASGGSNHDTASAGDNASDEISATETQDGAGKIPDDASGRSSHDTASRGGTAGDEISATETRDGAGKIPDDTDAVSE